MHPAEALVRRFLGLVSEFDLARGQELMAPGTVIIVPGGASTTSLGEMLARLKARYQRCDKSFDRFDILDQPSGETIIYCYGMLSGRWVDGTPFAGIRYIDRFVIRAGLIVDQQVWNDTAFVRPPPSQR